MKFAAGFVIGTIVGRRVLKRTIRFLNQVLPQPANGGTTRKAADFAYDVHTRLSEIADNYDAPQKENAR
jgi:hypothetical protein